MKQIEVIIPKIFSKEKIKAGVTKRNHDLFPPNGFSLSHIGLDESVFSENLEYFSNFLGIDCSDFRFNHQIHSEKIVIADEVQNIEEADALITDKKGLVLFVKLADCAGVLIYEPEVECIAAIHSGWKGTKLNITGKTILELQKLYDADPSKMLVYISPMASSRNYEVGNEFKDFFPQNVVYEVSNKLYYDNRKMIIKQLGGAGIKAENIEYSVLCTIENSDLHSYRRDKNNSGRMAAYIGMI